MNNGQPETERSALWITGAGGFTGRHLVAVLHDGPDRPRLVGLDHVPTRLSGLDACLPLDVTRVDDVAAAARQEPPKWVIHLAGALPPAGEAEMWHVQVNGTVALLRGLAEAGCRDARVVSVGSAAEYLPGAVPPLTETSPCGGSSPYGRCKWAQTLAALGVGRELGTEIMVVRPFNLLGPGQSANLVAGRLCRLLADVAADGEITAGNTRSARDFLDVRDAAAACWLVARHGKAGAVYNVCTGRATTIDHLIALLCELTGKSPRILTDPAHLRDADVDVSFGDHTRLSEATGWQPRIPLRDSLAAMLEAVGQAR